MAAVTAGETPNKKTRGLKHYCSLCLWVRRLRHFQDTCQKHHLGTGMRKQHKRTRVATPTQLLCTSCTQGANTTCISDSLLPPTHLIFAPLICHVLPVFFYDKFLPLDIHNCSNGPFVQSPDQCQFSVTDVNFFLFY